MAPRPASHAPAWGPTETSIGIVVLIALVALFWRWFAKQGQHSIDRMDDWGHAFVVPFFSAYMVWRRREDIARLEARPFWPGLLVSLLGIMCYFFFVVGVPNHMLQGASVVLTIAGVALLVLGARAFEHVFIPIAYLLFGITLAEQVMIRMTFPLQLIATKGAWLILKVISLPGSWFMVESSGNVMELTFHGRTIPLSVAEACSGMRMVIAFVALGAAVAILSCRHWWQRIALFSLAMPVAVFMNILRVAVLGLASLFNANLAAGNAHMIIGTLLLIPGLFLFLSVEWALRRMIADEPTAPGTQGGAA
ncbi:MAG: exosortase/archaeosortase family protein [Phycisphaerales bacterium]